MGDTFAPSQDGACLGRRVTSWTSVPGFCPSAGRREDRPARVGRLASGNGASRKRSRSLQISLEHNGTAFVSELHDNVEVPGPTGGRMSTPTLVMCHEPRADVR